MYNYYEYCKLISESYYPKIYNQLKNHVKLICDKYEKDKDMYPFPSIDKFQKLVNEVHELYIKEVYDGYKNGEILYNYNVDLRSELINDIIKLILTNKLMESREKYKNYPYFY